MHTGFFIGIIWFYWISFSLVYYNLAFLIPFEIFIIALIYGLMFLLCGLWQNKIIRAILLICVSYVHPFSFNWLNLELTLILGIFEPNLRGIMAVFVAIIVFYEVKKYKFILSALILCTGLQIFEKEPNFLPFETKLAGTDIPQSQKWVPQNKPKYIKEALNMIDTAINEKKKFIILPETAFVTFLNLDKSLIEILKEKSHQITILAGGLAFENRYSYNSAFLFQSGVMQRFDKHILVPFGEEIPLPNFIKNIANKLFFHGAQDFSKSSKVSSYTIKDINITNAICYEATRDEIYENNPKFVVAISNNGWFLPSTEPILQSALIKYYATKSGTTIYHSVNGSKSEIITPKKLWIKELVGALK